MANQTQVGEIYCQEPVDGVSVIIPALNEENAIATTIQGLQTALDPTGIDYEIILVDDGSTDNTRQNALDAGAQVVVHNKNMGYGNSLMDGIRASNFPVIAMLDADGTYPMAMLPRLIEEASRYDMVIGARQWTNSNTSFLARIYRKALFYLIRYLTSARAVDFNSGFRVFRKLDILDYKHLLCPTFSFTTTMTMIFLLTHRSVSFLEIDYSARVGLSKVSYFRDAIRTLSYIFMIANFFQAYRTTLFLLAIFFATSLSWWFIGLMLDVGATAQIVSQLTIASSFIISALALTAMPVAKLFIQALHQKRE